MGETVAIAAASVRSAGGGPLSVFALGPFPLPVSPWHLTHCSSKTARPRASEGGAAGNGSSAPGSAAPMRWTIVAERRSTESGDGARSRSRESRARSESVTARTGAGRNGASKRAWSRNCFASETSSGAVTRPPAGATPLRYSLAASEAAATMRRAAESESVAWPRAAGAARHHANAKQAKRLRGMRSNLSMSAPNTRRRLSGMQARKNSAAVGHQHRHRDRGLMGVRKREQHLPHAQLVGAGARQPGERDRGAAVLLPQNFDVPPADAARALASLQRLVDRFLRREPHRDVGRGVGARHAVVPLRPGEEPVVHVVALGGEHALDARHLHQVHAHAHCAHGRATKSLRWRIVAPIRTTTRYAPFPTGRPPLERSQTYCPADAGCDVTNTRSPRKV